MSDKTYSVYIVTNKHNMLYTGVTNDLKSRALSHKEKSPKGFAKKYNEDKLVYFEACGEILSAIAREKQIKAGSRKKNIELIESKNPKWLNLYDTI
jgi:putative endonuclease